MFDDFGGPGAGSKSLAGLIFGGALLWWTTLVPGQVGTLLALVGSWLFLAGILQGVLWLVARWIEGMQRLQDIRSSSPALRILELAHALTDEQRTVVQGLDYRAIEVDVLVTDTEMFFFLITPEARIPFTWLQSFLDDSGVLELRAIRTYSEGTPAYEWARAFTSWCERYHYALPSVGNRAAQWVNEHARDDLKVRFGFPTLSERWSAEYPSMTIIPAEES